MWATPAERGEMSRWVLVEDATPTANGSPDRLCWPTLEKPLDFTRRDVGRGRPVVGIQGPTGRIRGSLQPASRAVRNAPAR